MAPKKRPSGAARRARKGARVATAPANPPPGFLPGVGGGSGASSLIAPATIKVDQKSAKGFSGGSVFALNTSKIPDGFTGVEWRFCALPAAAGGKLRLTDSAWVGRVSSIWRRVGAIPPTDDKVFSAGDIEVCFWWEIRGYYL